MAKRAKHRFSRCLLGLLLACALVPVAAVVVANAATLLTTRDDVHVISDLEDYGADAVVVLGASVLPDGTPSDILKDRLETAVALYQAGAARAIIVSGDNRTSHYNESEAMKRYCVELGVPSDDVYEDHAGYSTYESMYRVKQVFGCKRVIVTTQAYHLYRALFAVQGLGVEACGVASYQGVYDNQDLYSLREAAARTKDFFQTIFRVPVEAAGDAVDLARSGDLT